MKAALDNSEPSNNEASSKKQIKVKKGEMSSIIDELVSKMDDGKK